MPADDADPVATLQRWEDFGGTWRVVRRDGPQVVVALCRCDGGEQVDELRSANPALRAWLALREAGA